MNQHKNRKGILALFVVAAAIFAAPSAVAAAICDDGFNISDDGSACGFFGGRGSVQEVVVHERKARKPSPLAGIGIGIDIMSGDAIGAATGIGSKIHNAQKYQAQQNAPDITVSFADADGIRAALFHNRVGRKIDNVRIEEGVLHLLVANESGAAVTYENSADEYFYAYDTHFPPLPLTAMIDESVTVDNGKQAVLRFAYIRPPGLPAVNKNPGAEKIDSTGIPRDLRKVYPYFSQTRAELTEEDCPHPWLLNKQGTECVWQDSWKDLL